MYRERGCAPIMGRARYSLITAHLKVFLIRITAIDKCDYVRSNIETLAFTILARHLF